MSRAWQCKCVRILVSNIHNSTYDSYTQWQTMWRLFFHTFWSFVCFFQCVFLIVAKLKQKKEKKKNRRLEYFCSFTWRKQAKWKKRREVENKYFIFNSMDYIFLLLGYILKASFSGVDFAIVVAVYSFGLWYKWIDSKRGVLVVFVFPFFFHS